MKLYYIYYAPDFIQVDGTKGKVGCTRWLEKRMRDQKITNYKILETHTDEVIAAKREKELQVEYDCVEKFVAIDYTHQLKWSSKSPVNKKGYKKTKEHCENMSKAHKGKKISKETREKIRKSSLGRKRPECSLPGENNPNSKLTETNVRWIRKHCFISKNRYALPPKGMYRAKEIAKMFNMNVAIIRGIVKKQTWKHIKP